MARQIILSKSDNKDEKDNLDILFVTCPLFTVVNPPIGMAYICEYLKKEGFNVGVYDLSIKIFNSLSTEFKKKWIDMKIDYSDKKEIFKLLNFSRKIINEFLVYLNKKNVRIIAFPILRSNRIFSYSVALEIKKRFSNKIIIFGGLGIFLPQERIDFFEECPNIHKVVDIFVKREGEIIIKKIIENTKNEYLFWDSLRNIKGIIYLNRRNNSNLIKKIREIIFNEKYYFDTGYPGRISDLDILPYPKYEEFNLNEYFHKSLPVTFGRGCVNQCSFCEDWGYWNGYICRSARNVFEEILYHVKKNKLIGFEFNDLAININLKELKEFCELVIKSKINILWNCNCVVRKDMPFGLFKKMKEAGCKIVRVGIESGSDRILRLMDKPFNSKQASQMLRYAHKAGLETHVNIIVGFPGEVEKDFKKTIDFIKKNKDYINKILNVSTCFIQPGTILKKYPHNYGIVTDAFGHIVPKEKTYCQWKDKFGNDPKERERKLLIIKDLLNSLKIPVLFLNK